MSDPHECPFDTNRSEPATPIEQLVLVVRQLWEDWADPQYGPANWGLLRTQLEQWGYAPDRIDKLTQHDIWNICMVRVTQEHRTVKVDMVPVTASFTVDSRGDGGEQPRMSHARRDELLAYHFSTREQRAPIHKRHVQIPTTLDEFAAFVKSREMQAHFFMCSVGPGIDRDLLVSLQASASRIAMDLNLPDDPPVPPTAPVSCDDAEIYYRAMQAWTAKSQSQAGGPRPTQQLPLAAPAMIKAGDAFAMLGIEELDETKRSKTLARIRKRAGDILKYENRGNAYWYEVVSWQRVVSLIKSAGGLESYIDPSPAEIAGRADGIRSKKYLGK